jgi:uncharacterized protein YjbI with pentapeptide repeats
MRTDEKAAGDLRNGLGSSGEPATTGRQPPDSAGGRGASAFLGKAWPINLCLAYLAYWALALVVNPVARMVVRKSALWPLIQVRSGWAAFLLVLPVLGIAALLAGWVSLRVERGSSVRRLIHLLCRALLPVFLVANFLWALRLHARGLAYAAGALLVAGTAAAWLPERQPPGMGPRPSFLRPPLRWAALSLGLGLEAFIVLQAIPWTGRGFYQGSFKSGLLRPLLQPLLSVNLSGLDLSSGSTDRMRPSGFAHARLEGARLVRVKARGLNFRMARLQTAVLNGADIARSDFSRATLNEAELDFVRATGADFSRATFFGTRSIGGDLREASFRSARLDYAKWIAVDARGSDWSGADFHQPGQIFGSNLEGADFKGASLAGTDLRKSDFSRADFQGADLRGALVWHSVFREANMAGADLRGTDADPDQLGAVRTLFRAKLDPALYEAVKARYPRLLEEPAICPPAAAKPGR